MLVPGVSFRRGFFPRRGVCAAETQKQSTQRRRRGLHCSEMVAIAPAKGARAPEKGSFPLDHGGECKPHMKAFLTCLEKNDRDHLPCKSLSKIYLACRMERNLMAKEEFDKLGFATEEEYQRIRSQATVQEGRKEGEGFVGGTHIRQRGGGWLSSWKKKDA